MMEEVMDEVNQPVLEMVAENIRENTMFQDQSLRMVAASYKMPSEKSW